MLPEVPTKELPVPPSYEESEGHNNKPSTNNPLPAPRSSLLEEAKVDKKSSKTKKNAKNHKKNKDTTGSTTVVPSSLYIENQPEMVVSKNRPLSPDSALASSESSGGKQGKNLIRITSYEPFKPVIRKSARIQEKIALFSPNPDHSDEKSGSGIPSKPKDCPNLLSKTINTYPRPRPLPDSVYQAPINRNAQLLIQEAQIKRAELFSTRSPDRFAML